MICSMAEWSSDAWKRYVREDGIDPNRILCRTIEDSDEEGVDQFHIEEAERVASGKDDGVVE